MDVNEVDYIKIGQRIRAARMELGWQQAEVAFRAGLTTSHMSHIETGQTKVALPTIVKIANTLSVSVDELLCDSLEQVKSVYDKKLQRNLQTAMPQSYKRCWRLYKNFWKINFKCM